MLILTRHQRVMGVLHSTQRSWP